MGLKWESPRNKFFGSDFKHLVACPAISVEYYRCTSLACMLAAATWQSTVLLTATEKIAEVMVTHIIEPKSLYRSRAPKIKKNKIYKRDIMQHFS